MKKTVLSFVLYLLSLQGNPSVIPWAFKQLGQLFDSSRTYLQFLETYVDSDNWFYRFFAAHELGTVFPVNKERVLSSLRELSRDENDMVREGAARSWSLILEVDFETGMEKLEQLQAGNYESRHTAALGPVNFYRDDEINSNESSRIETFWEQYKNDPRKGLRNLVQSQILDPYVNNH